MYDKILKESIAEFLIGTNERVPGWNYHSEKEESKNIRIKNSYEYFLWECEVNYKKELDNLEKKFQSKFDSLE